MRNIQTIQTKKNNSFDTSISSLVPPNRLDYTLDELKNYIKYNPYKYCNEIMGRSCGDGGPDSGVEWKQLGLYTRWVMAGGDCPNGVENRDSNCTTGCAKFFRCV
jgi:hypothetical protein